MQDAMPRRRGQRRSYPGGLTLVVGIVAAIVLVVLGIVWYGNVTTKEWPAVLVTDRDAVTVSSGSGKDLSVRNEYRVYLLTPDGVNHTVKVTDSILNARRTRSADVYAALSPGHCFHMETYGVRIGLFSEFPNVRNASEILCPAALAVRSG